MEIGLDNQPTVNLDDLQKLGTLSYFLPSNVWAFSALAPPRLEALIEERRPRRDFETLWYVNPAALASIPDVWHAHVLSRRRRRREEGRISE